MKRLIYLASLFALGLMAGAASASTWYVNPTGGSRYDATANPTGVCDGTSAAAPVGSTPNQHCAFSDIRNLWATGAYTTTVGAPAWGWIGASGDTYLIDCPSGGCRIGQSGPNPGDYYGWAGDPAGSGAPAPINGTSGNHTKIYGINHGACTTQGARTPIFGGFATGTVLSLSGSSYVDVACFDISDHSNCGRQGQVSTCQTSFPVGDFAGNGFGFNNLSNNISIADVRIHGMAVNGLAGPTGSNVTLSDIQILGNASSGWNADNGSVGLGPTLVQNFDISWNGCAEEYPIVDAQPYSDCTDDSGGGYGDGFGTATISALSNGAVGVAYSYQLPSGGVPPDTYVYNSGTIPPGLSVSSSGLVSGTPTTTGVYDFQIQVTDSTSANFYPQSQIAIGSYAQGWQVHFDQGTESYNTQDGLDALHLTGIGSSMTITRVLGYGSMGQQIKVGGRSGTAINNVLITNCNALRNAIPGTPTGYNTHLSDFCRAADTGIEMTTGKSSTLTFQFNTVYAANATAMEVDCDYSVGACDSSSLFDYRDNVFIGFINGTVSGYPGGGTGDYSNPVLINYSPDPWASPGSLYANNATFHAHSGWPCPNTGEGEVNALCTDPQLTDETWHIYGYGNVAPATSGSAVVAAGVTISGIPGDFNNATRANPPTMGACENTTTCPGASLAPSASTPTFSPVAGTYSSTQSVTISTLTGGATICYTSDGSTPLAATPGTCSHGTTYSTAVSVPASITLKAIATETAFINSSVGSAAYVITGGSAATTITGTITIIGGNPIQ